MLEIVEHEGVDVVLPQSSFDLEGLSAHRERFPVPVLVSRPDTIRRSNDKAETYAFLHRRRPRAGVPPRQRRRRGRGGRARARLPRPPRLLQAGLLVGLARFRVLDPTVDRAHQLLHERPGSVAMRLEEAVELLPER